VKQLCPFEIEGIRSKKDFSEKIPVFLIDEVISTPKGADILHRRNDDLYHIIRLFEENKSFENRGLTGSGNDLIASIWVLKLGKASILVQRDRLTNNKYCIDL
jgi:hypothetical protein